MTSVTELLKVAEEAELALRQNVVQLRLKEDGSAYQMRITKDTAMVDNAVFRDDVTRAEYRAANRAAKDRCQGSQGKTSES